MPQDLIVGLDIGTTKICAVVGEVREGQVDIVGLGCAPTAGGLRKGVVVNIENTVRAIRKAVEEAETMAGCEIRSVYAGVGGGQTKVIDSQGIIAIKDREVTPADRDRVIETARTVAIPSDREVIHTLVQDFLIDGQDGIKDPVGIHGVRLECKVHIVTGAVTSLNNILKCANRAGLEVNGIALQSLAAGEAVLTDEEKELGVALIDFGGGTTNLAIFAENALRHNFVLPVGGNNLTNDIAVGLPTSLHHAEELKKIYGACLNVLGDPMEMMEVPGLSGRETQQHAPGPPGGNYPSAGSGDRQPGGQGGPAGPVQLSPALRRRAHRRHLSGAGSPGTGRRGLPDAHPDRLPHGGERPGGRNPRPLLCHRRRPGALWLQNAAEGPA